MVGKSLMPAHAMQVCFKHFAETKQLLQRQMEALATHVDARVGAVETSNLCSSIVTTESSDCLNPEFHVTVVVILP